MPRKAPENLVCGATSESGTCNLPKGHEGDHQVVSPVALPVAEEVKTPPDATPEEAANAAMTVFGPDFVARPVIRKLAAIMGAIGEIKPEGKNDHFNYAFIKDTQVSGAIRPRMAAEHLIVIPEVLEESWVQTETKRGGVSWVTKLKVRFTVIDGDSGDSITGVGFGYGDDSGDKGANKAFTAAMKYWLIKLFQIGGEDDLENDARTDERSAQRQAGTAASGPTEVKIEGAKIEGIARGGRSQATTGAQVKQALKIYKDLELTPEKFVEIIEFQMGDKVEIPDEGDVAPVFLAYFRSIEAERMGKLISALADIKDQADDDAKDQAADGADQGMGYG